MDYLESGTPATRAAGPGKSRGKDYKEVLSPEDFAVFARLRDVRKEIAQAEAVPMYKVFTNEQLAQMVQNKVRTKADLTKISGVGDARLDKFGLAVLQRSAMSGREARTG